MYIKTYGFLLMLCAQQISTMASEPNDPAESPGIELSEEKSANPAVEPTAAERTATILQARGKQCQLSRTRLQSEKEERESKEEKAALIQTIHAEFPGAPTPNSLVELRVLELALRRNKK